MNGRRLLKGKYEIRGLLGEGGLAWVYAAKCHHTGNTVAVKILRPEIIRNNPEVIKRFTREADILRKLRHPHIVQFYDQGQEHGLHFIVLEWVDGFTLRQHIDKFGPLPVRRAMQVARDVASALSCAEQYGVVHRDIKPQNIIIDHYDWTKLMDFGIARARDISTMTHMGAILGTPQYLSPEQAKGEKVDIATDIYALGATLYEALCARPLFVADNPYAIIEKIVNEPPPRLALSGEEIPPAALPAIDALVGQCLAKDRSQRHKSASNLLAAVDEILAGLDEDRSDTSPFLDNLLARVAEEGKLASNAESRSARTPAGPRSFYGRSVAERIPFRGGGDMEMAGKSKNEQITPPAARGAARATLTVAGSGRVFAIEKDEIRVGRMDEKLKILPDLDLSAEKLGKAIHRRHARLFYRDGCWYLIAEAGAEKDTVVNGQALRMDQGAVRLANGSHIRLSRAIDLTFRIVQ